MASSDSSGISNIEKSEWIVSRIDLQHKNTIEHFTNILKKFEIGIDKAIRKLKEWRSYLLAPIGVGFTVLLGVASIFSIDALIFWSILSLMAIAGALIFVSFTKQIGIIESLSADVDFITTNGIDKIVQSQAFITTSVADLSYLDYDDLFNYMNFTNLLTVAVMLSLSKDFKELSVRYKPRRGFRKDLDFSENLESISDLYAKVPDTMVKLFEFFDRTKLVHPELLKFVEDAFKDYKPEKT